MDSDGKRNAEHERRKAILREVGWDEEFRENEAAILFFEAVLNFRQGKLPAAANQLDSLIARYRNLSDTFSGEPPTDNSSIRASVELTKAILLYDAKESRALAKNLFSRILASYPNEIRARFPDGSGNLFVGTAKAAAIEFLARAARKEGRFQEAVRLHEKLAVEMPESFFTDHEGGTDMFWTFGCDAVNSIHSIFLQDLKDARSGVKRLEGLAEKMAVSEAQCCALLGIAKIYDEQMKDGRKALRIYERIEKTYPPDPAEESERSDIMQGRRRFQELKAELDKKSP